MPYSLIKTNGQQLTIVQDGTLDNFTTDLVFVGKNYTGYGDPINENFIKLLENFANSVAPKKPLVGQQWYDTSNKKLKLYDGTKFKSVAILDYGITKPINMNAGDLHFSRTDKKLYAYDGAEWLPIGPATDTGAGTGSGLPITTIVDTNANSHSIVPIVLKNNLNVDTTGTIFSVDNEFSVPSLDSLYNEYPKIYPGITLPGATSLGASAHYEGTNLVGYSLWGTAATALNLVDYGTNGLEYLGIRDIVRKSELTTGTVYPLVILNDDGITIGLQKVLKIHITDSNVANISVINGDRLQFNLKTDAGLYTNIINLDAENGLAVLPTSLSPVALGNADAKFSNFHVNTVTSTRVTSTGSIYSPLITATNITATNLSIVNVSATNVLSKVVSSPIITVTTLTGSMIYSNQVSSNAVTANEIYDSNARVLTTATIGNYVLNSVQGTPNQVTANTVNGTVTIGLSNTVSVNSLTASVIAGTIVYSGGLPVLTNATLPSSGVSTIQGTAGQVLVNGGIGSTTGSATLSLASTVNVNTLQAFVVRDNGARVITTATFSTALNEIFTATLSPVISSYAVTGFSAGTTGLTPNTSTRGTVTLAGTLSAQNGGTGHSTYTTGDILIASSPTVLSKLAAVAQGNALISSGVGAAAGWGKIGLATHVSGTLPIANGGTGVTTLADLQRLVFPSGTTMLFAQAAAPTGWTKITIADNAALRVVSGAGGGSGGSVNFTTAFSSQAVSGTVGGTALTVDQIPPHDHSVAQWTVDAVDDGGSAPNAIRTTYSNTVTGSTGGGQAHSHSFSGTAINLAVKYVDAIVATKD